MQSVNRADRWHLWPPHGLLSPQVLCARKKLIGNIEANMQPLSPQRGGDSLFRIAMPDKKSEATAYKKDLIGLLRSGLDN